MKHTTRKTTTVAILCLTALFLITTQATTASAENLRRTPVVRVVEAVSPAVVNITSTKVERSTFGFGTGNPYFDKLLEEYGFGGNMQNRTQPTERKRSSLGSGVIINGKRGLVLTNAHVINGASEIEVRLKDGRKYSAELIGADPDFDLAVLRLPKGKNLPQIKMGDSSDIYIGETVVAIGNPFGFTHTVTTGVVSALNRSVQTKRGTFTDFIQTDTAINPGNSGGPLLNILGELIGINTAIRAGAEGIGFAIPINKARRVINELIRTGHVSPVWLGMFGQDLDQQMANYLGLPSTRGMLVSEVCEFGPAKPAGIRPGDVIIGLNNTRVNDKNNFLDLTRNYTRDMTVSIKLVRNGKTMRVPISAESISPRQIDDLIQKRWGLTAERQSARGATLGVIRQGSPAGRLRLAQGDILHQVGNQNIDTIDDLRRAFLRYRLQNAVFLKVQRGNRLYHLRLGL